MNRLIRTLAVTGAAGAMALLAVPAQAATTHSATTTGTCTTVNGSNSMGTGQITICPQSDGTSHLTGWLDNPSNSIPFNPNSGCNPGWWLNEATGGGEIGAQWGGNYTSTHYTFDDTITPSAPITGATFEVFCA
ncbi:hypothetical protein E6W39_11250 [Kitasatospora acidiphila]|uniref:Secreted protein n=1 Tax=Kitasatospora acidiphila TaxID=2567942 RepID=A0A540W189_9ACTN|nr:hypothetical protein [Kitasatospora acidiphila]TQF02727.1 hypothetical protein E6W39_11250 [Kitasatospora acidiphila]